MTACTRSGSVLNVGGISADSRIPRRPLVPAPTNMIRPPLRNAEAIMSIPTAMRSRSRFTASSILRSSLTIRSTMSSGSSLSMPRLDGLIASVGSDCHFDRTAIDPHSKLDILSRLPPEGGSYLRLGGSYVQAETRCSGSDVLIDSYLTHLTVERWLAANSVDSYARDLALLGAFAAGRETPLDRLARADLEALVRDLMAEGRSPRSVARAVACFRGFYRYLVIEDRKSTRLNSSHGYISYAVFCLKK